MKTKLLKIALCAMATLPMGAWAEEAKVTNTTNWLFNNLSAETVYKTYTELDGLYLRTNQSGRSFTVKSCSATELEFADGYHVTATNYLYMNNNATYNGTDALVVTSTAGDESDLGRGMIAINATVAGTFYVKIKGVTSGKVIRTYFADGTNINAKSITSDGTIQEISYTSSKAGSFFVGGITTGTSEIYAARFVPTSEKKDEWVYIGSTGYATWSNLSGKDIESLPEGLTAYSATAGAAGSATITLSALDKMRHTQAYVLKGTANTNYPLTYGGTDLTDAYNGGDMQRVTADMADFAAIITGDGSKTRYRYILGNDNGTAKFFVPSGGTLKKGKAYLQTLKNLTTSSAREINIVIEDEPTAIKTVNKSLNNGKYYNLQGVEVAQPTKGLYIVNGKKVMIK